MSLDYASSMVQINFGSDWFSCSSITHTSGGLWHRATCPTPPHCCPTAIIQQPVGQFRHPATPQHNLRAARSGAPACRSWAFPFQSPCTRIRQQQLHLLDGGLVEQLQPLGLRHPLVDEMCVSDSRLARQTSCEALASSRMLPLLPGFSSRHCFAVLPKSAMFSKSASLA